MTRRFDRKGYQRDMGRCTGTRKYSNGRIGRCDHPSHGCFTGEMRVLTPTGLARIDSLSVGSSVMVFDVRSGALLESRVKKFIRHPPAATLNIRFVGVERQLKVTSDHSLRVGGGWMKAEALSPGMNVQSGQGVLEVAAIAKGEKEPVYNLYPYGEKTFVVEGVVAHSFTRFRRLRELTHVLIETAFRPAPRPVPLTA